MLCFSALCYQIELQTNEIGSLGVHFGKVKPEVKLRCFRIIYSVGNHSSETQTNRKGMEASKSLNCLFTRDHLRDICSFVKLALRYSRKLSLGNINCLSETIELEHDQTFGNTLIKTTWTNEPIHRTPIHNWRFTLLYRLFRRGEKFAAQKVYSNKLLYRRRVSNVRLVWHIDKFNYKFRGKNDNIYDSFSYISAAFEYFRIKCFAIERSPATQYQS